MTKSPVKKKPIGKKPVGKKLAAAKQMFKDPTEVNNQPPTDKPKATEYTVRDKKHLMELIMNASDDALHELYMAMLGGNWKHRIAELGLVIREIKYQRKYGQAREETVRESTG